MSVSLNDLDKLQLEITQIVDSNVNCTKSGNVNWKVNLF